MKIPACRIAKCKNGENRLTINGKTIAQKYPVCNACGRKRKHGETDDYHVFLWEDARSARLAVIPMIFCYRCAIDFSKTEDCELGYIAHSDLIESGMRELIIFPAQKGKNAKDT